MISQASQLPEELLLYEACRLQGLTPEQQLERMPYREYFREYGISRKLFRHIWNSDLAFRLGFSSTESWEEAYDWYKQEYRLLEANWPRWVHLYEEIQRRFPKFNYRVDQGSGRIEFDGYPCRPDGSRVSLLEIAQNPEVLRDCVPEKRRRRRFLACGVWCQ